MEKGLIVFLLLFFFTVQSFASNLCIPDACNAAIGPEIAFPFRLSGRSSERCGYPGFDLRCNSRNQTIIQLPESGEFIVSQIDYSSQVLFINDPNSCLPARLLNFSLGNSPFQGPYMMNYTFYNCSSNYTNFTSPNFMPLDCLSGRNYTVLAGSSRSTVAADIPVACRPFATVPIPLQWMMLSQLSWPPPENLNRNIELLWSEPSCGECVGQRGVCGFKSDSGLDVACFRTSKPGLPRGVKYAIILGAGIPSLVCIIGLACYICGNIRNFRHRHNVDSGLPISDQRSSITSTYGLDMPTIESYPTTVLGESRRVPETSDGTCPICLSDYQPKETIRSIPECNHCFHTSCIDEWLKLNVTCPVCRNSPAGSSTSPSTILSEATSSTDSPSSPSEVADHR